MLSEKKLKFMGEAATPSESEVDMGIFSKKSGNPLQKIFEASSAPRSSKFGRSGDKIDVSKITPPTSHPSSSFDFSPPNPDPKGKGKEDDAERDKTEKLVENVVGGVEVEKGGVHVEGVETEWESSEATPQGTVHTKRIHTSRGGGASGSRQGPEIHRVEGGGSWTYHNPACDDLPHVPRWGLTQASRMASLPNCREFYSLLLPPAERLFQKNFHRMDLLDNHIHVGVNYFSTTQEIVREWHAMGKDTLEFEAAKKEFAAEREAFNAEKKGLLWRVADNEEKLAKEKPFNANHQKEWEDACERTNQELKSTRDEVIK
ncbi:hypothetical protein Hdeb2414_s0080g00780081 [Helianthus debilis subsp. tardiflorus]